MKRNIVARVLFVCIATLLITTVHAQNPFEDAVKQISSDNVRGYLQPFINGFGANLNSGFYHTAEIGDMGIHFEIRAVGMATLIGDAEKTYYAVAPQPYSQTPVQTATLFGTTGASVPGPAPGVEYHFQNGQVKTDFIPFAAPQLTIDNIMGTQAIIRYAPIPEIGDFPKITLFGIGARHSVSRYLPSSPVDISAGIFYQSFKVGDIIEAKALSFGAQASKSFSVATLYGGMQYESASMTLNYTYTGQGSTPNTKVNLDLDSENKFRVTAGLSLNLVILNLNADVNFGKVTVVSGGVGFGM